MYEYDTDLDAHKRGDEPMTNLIFLLFRSICPVIQLVLLEQLEVVADLGDEAVGWWPLPGNPGGGGFLAPTPISLSLSLSLSRRIAL